jgi:Calcineurin-like phosphoesterase superfamily domain
MPIALISGIHSNRIALRAALADIRRTGVDHIVCLGDVANLGPEPNAVIEILVDLGCPCIVGNHDEFLLDPTLVHMYSDLPRVVASVDWSRSRLSAVERLPPPRLNRSCRFPKAVIYHRDFETGSKL